MTSAPTAFASWLGLGLCSALAFTPLGCGSPAEIHVPAYSASADPTLPAPTIAALSACVEEGAARLTNTSYAIFFDVDVGADGRAQNARVKDSIVHDQRVESCLVHALAGLSLPASIMRMRKPARVSPDSRRYMGNAAAPVLVALGPIAIAAAGITILVVVTVYVVSDTVTATRDATDDEGAERERCKRAKTRCIDECTENHMPSGQPDGMPYHDCLRKCLEAADCWKMFK